MKNKKGKTVEKTKGVASEMFNFPQVDSDITVWLSFEGKEYELSQFGIKFYQGIDYKGEPQDETRGGIINLLLTEVVPDNIYKWVMTSSMRNGSIEFRSKTANAPLKIEFTDGFCVNMERVVDASRGVVTTLVVSPKELKINGIDFSNNWV